MVRVTTEIGRLVRVLVHEPGAEVDRMVPSMMEDLLFDDILYGERAREEHAMFRQLLRLLGIEVVEAGDWLAATLDDPRAREWLLEVLLEDLPLALRDQMRGIEAPRLARALVRGVRREDAPDAGIEPSALFDLAPMPNWCFQRDPQIVLGSGVVFCSMASSARHREALLSRMIFRFHPELRDVPVWFDPMRAREDQPFIVGLQAQHLEGGDVLVLSPDVVAVGHSERTNRAAIVHLARALRRLDGGPRWLVVVELPKRRAYMHLDTLITPVDHDACLVYPPVIVDGGAEAARVSALDLHADDPANAAEHGDALLPLLARKGVELRPLRCGGADRVAQQREQWTDGANALALAPGVVTLYDRNVATAEELDRDGFEIVSARDVLLGRASVSLEAERKVCVLVASHEISRARGGPHCLTHPLVREDVR